MRILMICTVPFSKTGIPCHIRNYYNELNKLDFEIDICASYFDPEFLVTLDQSTKANLIRLRRGRVFSYISKLRKVIKKNQYDIVHIHGNSSTMALELFSCVGLKQPVRVVHGHNTSCSHPIINRAFKPFLLHLSDVKCACSKKAGDWLYGANQPYTVIKNGIVASDFDFDKTKRKKIRADLVIADDCLVIGHVGIFNEQKNQKFLIEVAKKLNLDKYKIVMIGADENESKEKVINLAANANLGPKIQILEAQNDIAGYYSSFDIFVFPSNWEGLGMVLIEAQYAGLPCLVSDQVPSETKISENFRYLPLKVDIWTQAIHEFQEDLGRDRTELNLHESYDIRDCTAVLRDLYQVWAAAK